MSYLENTRPVTLNELARMRAEGEKIAVLTCYDASFAALLARCGVDVLLVGDSLGNVLQGQASTLPVTLEQMAYHTGCVARGLGRQGRPFVVADMPFGSYQESPAQAMRSAVPLMAAGAQMVKLEGGAFMAETVRFLVERGVPVCAHVGLTPQSVHQLGGYRVQGKSDAAAQRMRAMWPSCKLPMVGTKEMRPAPFRAVRRPAIVSWICIVNSSVPRQESCRS